MRQAPKGLGGARSLASRLVLTMAPPQRTASPVLVHDAVGFVVILRIDPVAVERGRAADLARARSGLPPRRSGPRWPCAATLTSARGPIGSCASRARVFAQRVFARRSAHRYIRQIHPRTFSISSAEKPIVSPHDLHPLSPHDGRGCRWGAGRVEKRWWRGAARVTRPVHARTQPQHRKPT